MCRGAADYKQADARRSEARGDPLRLLLTLGNSPRERGDDRGGNTGAASKELPSFETLLQLCHKRIYNLVYRLIGNLDEAADLTQETFVRAYRAYPRFRGETAAVYPWLCRIAVNACKNKFRELSRRGMHEVRSLDDPLSGLESELHIEVRGSSADPVGVAQRRELEAKIQDALQALPVGYRTVVVLRDMNGLSYKEIAEATGLTTEVVKSRLFRARGMLRRRLAAYLDE